MAKNIRIVLLWIWRVFSLTAGPGLVMQAFCAAAAAGSPDMENIE